MEQVERTGEACEATSAPTLQRYITYMYSSSLSPRSKSRPLRFVINFVSLTRLCLLIADSERGVRHQWRKLCKCLSGQMRWRNTRGPQGICGTPKKSCTTVCPPPGVSLPSSPHMTQFSTNAKTSPEIQNLDVQTFNVSSACASNSCVDKSLDCCAPHEESACGIYFTLSMFPAASS